MTAITVREFSYNPSAMFSRVENGETIEITRHGKVIAELIPPRRYASRLDELIARGEIIPSRTGRTTAELDKYTRIEVPSDADPLAILLEMREDER